MDENYIRIYERLLELFEECRRIIGKPDATFFELNNEYCHIKPAWSNYDNIQTGNNFLFPYKNNENNMSFKIVNKNVEEPNFDNYTWEECINTISTYHVTIPTQVLEKKWKEYVMSDRFIPTPTSHGISQDTGIISKELYNKDSGS